jgi:GTP-binding protein
MPTKSKFRIVRSTKPVVAIVGRENVGKSTLFNRLVGHHQVIVSNRPGTTRDRIFGDVVWRGETFTLVDTAGLAHEKRGFTQVIHDQVAVACKDADVILFAVDGKEGATPIDRKIARWLLSYKKPVFVVVNKVDRPNQEEHFTLPFYELGFKNVVPISALSGKQVGDMLDAIFPSMHFKAQETDPTLMRIAIVGKPNVGKSTLMNALTGEARARVSATPGTTRDPLSAEIRFEGKIAKVVDTAGIRRRARIHEKVEKESSIKSLKEINHADVVLLLFDATEPTSQQDLAIARFAIEARKVIVLGVNKWDLVSNKAVKFEKYIEYFQHKLPQLFWAPIIFLSAKGDENIDGLLDALHLGFSHFIQQFPQEIFQLLQTGLGKKGKKKKEHLKISTLTQVAVAPPAFAMTINSAELLSSFHLRRVEKILREHLSLEGTPIILHYQVPA